MAKSEFCMLAHSAVTTNLWPYTGWFMSRKLRGHRALWDGGVTIGKVAGQVPWSTNRDKGATCTGLWSSRGKIINVPRDYTKDFPNSPLDGELWINDDEALVKSICGQGHMGRWDRRWMCVKYMVFSIPNIFVQGLLGQTNEWIIDKLVSAKFSSLYISVVRQFRAENPATILEFYENIIAAGGEGIMLLNPAERYVAERTWGLMKLKPDFDAEAKVVGVTQGEGRNDGKIGALICNLTWDEKILGFTGGRESFINKNVSFNVSGLNDAERVQTNWVGKIIKFKFLYISDGGIPISPNIDRG